MIIFITLYYWLHWFSIRCFHIIDYFPYYLLPLLFHYADAAATLIISLFSDTPFIIWYYCHIDIFSLLLLFLLILYWSLRFLIDYLFSIIDYFLYWLPADAFSFLLMPFSLFSHFTLLIIAFFSISFWCSYFFLIFHSFSLPLFILRHFHILLISFDFDADATPLLLMMPFDILLIFSALLLLIIYMLPPLLISWYFTHYFRYFTLLFYLYSYLAASAIVWLFLYCWYVISPATILSELMPHYIIEMPQITMSILSYFIDFITIADIDILFIDYFHISLFSSISIFSSLSLFWIDELPLFIFISLLIILLPYIIDLLDYLFI